MNEALTKPCTLCSKVKSLQEFHRHPQTQDGRKTRCRDCQKIYMNEYRSRPEVSLRKRQLHLKNSYNLTVEQWDIMYINQKGKCLICNKHSTTLSKNLRVDHCHETGEVRGLLCDGCNTGIGLLEENTDTLRGAIAYLNKGN